MAWGFGGISLIDLAMKFIISRSFALFFGLLLAAPAFAAGMFITPHGARPLARGGAFVAGADDLNAIYYNPAGIVLAPTNQQGLSLFLDAGMALQSVTFTRNDNGIMRPAVQADTGVLGGAPLAIPQLAISKTWKRPFGSVAFGFGLWIPYASLLKYPEPRYDSEEAIRNAPNVGPQRHALISLHEGSLAKSTLLAVLNPAVAVSLLNNRLQVGIGPQLMLVYFRSRIAISACPEIICRPEQVDFDTVVSAQAFAITPSFNIGGMYKPLSWLRVGASFQFPFFIRSLKGRIDARLPPHEFFKGASVQGHDAELALNLPATLRLGAEFYPYKEQIRIEAAYTLEGWSLQESITFTPRNIAIVDTRALGTYPLGEIRLPRGMVNSHSFHLGGEWFAHRYITARLGTMVETSAVPDATLTVLTPDNTKAALTMGLAIPNLKVGKMLLRLDLSYAHIFQIDRTVLPENSQIYPANPIRPPAVYPAGAGGIGAGSYKVSQDILALGLSLSL